MRGVRRVFALAKPFPVVVVLHFGEEVKKKNKCILVFFIWKIKNIEDSCEKMSNSLHLYEEFQKPAARTLSFLSEALSGNDWMLDDQELPIEKEPLSRKLVWGKRTFKSIMFL